MTALRIGLIGAGLIGQKHAATMAASRECRLAAVADPAEKAPGFATRHGARHFADHRSMLEYCALDGAIVASPNTMHVPMALDCLERGLPVLLEKPVADCLASGAQLVQCAARTRVPVLVGHHRRHNPLVARARTLVQDGAIGRLNAVTGQFVIRKPDDYFAVDWRRKRGAGPILLNGIHDIDNLRQICGEIAGVQAMKGHNARQLEVEDTACILLRFESGAIGTLTICDAAPSPWSWELTAGENIAFPRQDESCYLFAGTEGSLAFPALDLWHYQAGSGWQQPLSRTRQTVVPQEPFAAQLAHFARVIRGEEAPLVTVADGLRTLAVVEAIHLAAELERYVAVSELLRDEAAA